MTTRIKIIHSSTLMNFYFDFEDYCEKIPHKNKNRATEFWCKSYKVSLYKLSLSQSTKKGSSKEQPWYLSSVPVSRSSNAGWFEEVPPPSLGNSLTFSAIVLKD